ncbi:MAG TPA: hypothetical protein VFJ09_07380 [Nocardioidaceae bacterium]|nr:hypothetical protein [Nocardioidaceae bacterium]
MGEKDAQASVVTAGKTAGTTYEPPVEQALPAGPDYWPVPLQQRRHND